MMRLSTAKRLAVVAVAVLAGACGQGEPTGSTGPQNGEIDAEDAPFDVAEVVRHMQLRYRPEDSAFVGHVENMDVRAESGVVRFSPNHWRWALGVQPKDRPSVSEEAQVVEGASLTIETVAIQRSEALSIGQGRTYLGEDGSLRIDRGVAEERFINHEKNVEQEWHFDRAPAGEGDMIVAVQVAGQAYVGWDEDGHHFMDEETSVGVRYGNATWIDGAGRKTPVPVEYEDGALFIVVAAETLSESAYPAVLDPTVSAEFQLTNPSSGNPSTYNQNQPAVAFDGTNYLVVWEDQRSGYSYDIYGARFTQGNQLLDGSSFVISEAAGDQRRPEVAFNGTNYLVVWSDLRGGSNFDVYGARVTPAGGVLDPGGIAISAAAADQDDPAVSASGSTWVVAWRDGRNGTDNIFAARVGAGGNVADPVGIALAPGATVQNEPAIAASSTVALVAYTSAGIDVRATRLDTTTGAVLTSTGVGVSGSTDRLPAVAFDGTNFLVVYQRDGQGNLRDINGVRVTQGGTPLDSAEGFVINGEPGNARVPSVTFGNGRYLVAWHDDKLTSTAPDVLAATVLPDGTVNQTRGFLINGVTDWQVYPDVAAGSGGFLAVWEDRRNRDPDVYGVALQSSGAPTNSTGFVISTGANRQFAPSVVFKDPFFFVVYQDSRRSGGTDYDLKGVRIRVSGTIADPYGLNITNAAGNQAAPALTYNPVDDEILVVWTDRRAGNWDIRARLYAPNWVPTPERVIASGPADETFPRVAYNSAAGRYLVAWQDERGGDFDVYAARVDNVTANVVDPGGNLVVSAANDQRSVDVASDGLVWLVAWEDDRNGPDTEDIRGAIVNFANTVSIPDFAISTAPNVQAAVRVAYDGTNFVAVWGDARTGILGTSDVYAARITSGGIVLDPAGIGLATSGSLNEGRPGVAIVDDTNVGGPTWFVVWRQDAAPGSQARDLFGRQFTTAGVPVAPGFTVSAQAGSEDQLSVAQGRPNRAFVSYQRFSSATGVNQERVFSRFVYFP